MYPRTKVLQRRREVVSLLVRGVPPGEIAEMLKVPCDTIYNDIRAIRSGRNEALNAYSRREIVAQLYLNLQARVRYLWKMADKAESDYACLWTMRELRLNDEHILNKLPPILSGAELREDEERHAHIRGIIHSLLHKKPEPPPPAPPEEKKHKKTKYEIEEMHRIDAEQMAEFDRRREEEDKRMKAQPRSWAPNPPSASPEEIAVKRLFEEFGMTEEDIIEAKRLSEKDAMTEEEIAEMHRREEEEAAEILRRRAEKRRRMEAEGSCDV